MRSDLIELIVSMFNLAELGRFIQRVACLKTLPDPPNGNVLSLAEYVVDAATRRGLVPDPLLSCLREARPYRVDDIDQLCAKWCDHGSRESSEAELAERCLQSLDCFPLDQIAGEMRPFLSLAANHGGREMCQIVEAMLDRTVTLLGNSPPNSSRKRLRHSGQLLRFFNNLVGPIENVHPRPLDYRVASPWHASLAAFSALLHNLALADCVLHHHDKKKSYLGRSEDFLHRVAVLERKYLEAVRPIGEVAERFVRQAFWVGREMYRDSAYWAHSAQEYPALASAHDRMRDSVELGEHATKLAVVLRMCEAMDVEHRAIPDLVRDLFARAEYVPGLECFYEHTFEHDKPFLLHTTPVLSGGQLRLCFIDLPDPSVAQALTHAREVIESSVSAQLARLAALVPEHPNLVVSVHRRTECLAVNADRTERLLHLCWALFPLVVAFPGSDTDAAESVARLFPHLVTYIDRFDQLLQAGGSHTEEHVRRLFMVIRRLRHSSHATLQVCDQLKREYDTCDGPSIARAHASSAKVLRSISEQRVAFYRSPHSDLENATYVAFGASRPAAQWLAARLDGGGTEARVYLIACVRRFLRESSTFVAGAATTLEEHNCMRRLIQRSRTSSTPDEGLHDTIDAAFLRRLHDEQGARQIELVLGARSFVSVRGQPHALCTYGSGNLTLVAKQLGIRVRIVTSRARLGSPIVDFTRSGDDRRGFDFTYSAMPLPNTEDELIPLSDITTVTLEDEHLSGRGAGDFVARAASRHVEAQAEQVDKIEAASIGLPRLLQVD